MSEEAAPTQSAVEPTDMRTELIRALTQRMLHQINQFDYSELKDETKNIIVHAVVLACTHACKDVGLIKELFLNLCSVYADSVYGKEA